MSRAAIQVHVAGPVKQGGRQVWVVGASAKAADAAGNIVRIQVESREEADRIATELGNLIALALTAGGAREGG